MPTNAIEYLMAGDPAIRWQVMWDITNSPKSDWQEERLRVAKEGWGARIMENRLADGHWPVGRWTGTVWTLCTLVSLGFPRKDPRLSNAFNCLATKLIHEGQPLSRHRLTTEMDLCHLGFWLRIGSYFNPEDQRLPELAQLIIDLQLDDGGWNCRIRTAPKTKHGSFHTTFNVLEGLREAASSGVVPTKDFEQSERRAIEFMLQHKMYRSDRTGEVVNERFLDLTYPSHWHYTVLRGLDYIQASKYISDPRLTDSLEYLEARRKSTGRWVVEKRIPGTTLFEMEKMGQESRWNTLRALRVLLRAGRISSLGELQ